MNKSEIKQLFLNKKFEKSVEYTILGLSMVYFVLFIVYDTHSIGFDDILPKFENFDFYFDLVLWSIFVVMIPDLITKYFKADNWKVFLKKNWIDISFFILIPLFAGLRALKILQFASQLKSIKMLKSLLKVLYEGKKVLVPVLLGYKLIQLITKRRKEKSKLVRDEK
jgi:hypothetical protein